MDDNYSKVIIFDLDDTLFDSTNQPLETPNGWPLELFSGWQPILQVESYNNILVTMGEPELQNKKIDALGIRQYFSKIYIVDRNEDKATCFAEVIKEFPNQDIIVVGNRLDSEIRYGNQLGLKTIFVKYGKYKDMVAKDKFENPTYTIETEDLVNFLHLV